MHPRNTTLQSIHQFMQRRQIPNLRFLLRSPFKQKKPIVEPLPSKPTQKQYPQYGSFRALKFKRMSQSRESLDLPHRKPL